MVPGLWIRRSRTTSADAACRATTYMFSLASRLHYQNITHRFLPFLLGSYSSSSSSSRGIILSKKSNNSVNSSSFLNSSSLNPSSCFANFLEMDDSNLLKALRQTASRRGRRCEYQYVNDARQRIHSQHTMLKVSISSLSERIL